MMMGTEIEDHPRLQNSYPDLADKVVLITGGSRGIGAATALAFGANGSHVVVVGRDRGALDETVRAVNAKGDRALAIVTDCTNETEIANLSRQIDNHFGRVDVLAVFAGGNGMPVPTALETSTHWREVIETDMTSSFLTVSAFLPGMMARGSGAIITMASSAARQASRSSAAYAAAKGGVVAFSRHLAHEVASAGVRVNCLAPSAIENERMRAWTTEEQRRQLSADFPLGRMGQPEDVAAAALFLGSSASSWITGVTLDVAGGKVML
jgi:3-oxoacyl-[acyl-carrier protein] reductase